MAIKNFFKDKSFWGLLTAWSFLGAVAMGIIYIPIFVLWPDMPEGLFHFLEKTAAWGFPILLAAFAFASGIRNKEIVGAIKVVPEGEQKKKEKYVNPYSEETKRYYKRWGKAGLISFLLFLLLSAALFLMYLFSDFFSKLLFILDWGLIVFGCIAIGIYLKGDSKGVFFKSTEEEESK